MQRPKTPYVIVGSTGYHLPPWSNWPDSLIEAVLDRKLKTLAQLKRDGVDTSGFETRRMMTAISSTWGKR